MAVGRYRTPKPLKDEDKYGPFTKIQLLTMLPFVLVGLLIGTRFLNAKMYVPGISFILIGVINGIVFAVPDIPIRTYLYAGGMPLRSIAFRVLYRFTHRKIYTKNLKEEYDR